MTGNTKTRGIKLKNGFREERKKERLSQRLGWQSLYLQPFVTQQWFELKCENGIFSYSHNRIMELHGRYLYVRTLSGQILAAKEGEIGHHSYLSNGKKVLSAGLMIFDRGRLQLFSNESGHYRPTTEEMASEIIFFHNIAENQDLIYEDHSRHPHSGEIVQYQTKSIIAMGDIARTYPSAILMSKASHFGRQLNSIPAAIDGSFVMEPSDLTYQSNYQDEQFFLSLTNEAEEVSNNYLDDEYLMHGFYEDQTLLLAKFQALTKSPLDSHGFFAGKARFKDEINLVADMMVAETPK